MEPVYTRTAANAIPLRPFPEKEKEHPGWVLFGVDLPGAQPLQADWMWPMTHLGWAKPTNL